MPYTIQDAMQAEVELLREMAQVEDKAKRTIVAAIYREQANSFQRVLNRLQGYDYSLKIMDGEIKRVHTKSGRKTLEEEYPALRKAAENYDLIQTLVDSTPDNADEQ
jgi:excinuclease UvrABC ATPase subunit